MPSSRLLCLSSALLCVLIVSSSHMCPSWLPALSVSVSDLISCQLPAPALCICIYLDTLYTYLLTRYLYTVHTDIHILIPIQYIEIYYTYTLYILYLYILTLYILYIYTYTVHIIYIIRQYIIYTVHIQILYTYTPYNYKYNINILIIY